MKSSLLARLELQPGHFLQAAGSLHLPEASFWQTQLAFLAGAALGATFCDVVRAAGWAERVEAGALVSAALLTVTCFNKYYDPMKSNVK